jgi:hypothetical protein
MSTFRLYFRIGAVLSAKLIKLTLMNILILLTITVALSGEVLAQLPEAPAPSATCITHDKSCPEWVHKLIGQYPPAPARLRLPSVMPGPVHVYTFRKHWDDPPLRSYRKTFTSPWFLVSQGAMFASMVIACRRSQFTGEEFQSEAPWVVGVFGINLLTDRYLDELYSVGSAVIVTQHYAHATVSGRVNY